LTTISYTTSLKLFKLGVCNELPILIRKSDLIPDKTVTKQAQVVTIGVKGCAKC